MNRHFSLKVDEPHPSRTLYFPDLPGRGGADNAVLDYSDHQGYTRADDEDPRSVYWRGFVGTFIAEHLGHDITRAWHVHSWPKGYALWIKERPGTKHVDCYLYGFGGRKAFRSPREFGFHALWLYDDNYFAAGDQACQCTLHTDRPQSVINAEWIWGEERRPNSNSHSAGGRNGGGGGRRERDNDDGAMNSSDDEQGVRSTVRYSRSKQSLLAATGGPTPHPRWQPPPQLIAAGVRNPQPAPQISDTRFRGGELVWVTVEKLDPWIPGDEAITAWPALVLRHSDGQLPHTLNVKLLGVDTRSNVHESQVHAWQTRPLPPDFLQRQLPFLGGERMRAKDDLKQFRPLPASLDPLPLPVPRRYDLAVLPYSIALQQAARIARQYTPVERTQPAFGKIGYRGVYVGSDRVQVEDWVRLAPTREDFKDRGIARKWFPASHGAAARPLYGLVMQIYEAEGDEALKFTARIFELQSDQKRYMDYGDQLPEAPEGFKFREVTAGKTSVQNLPITDIASRYDREEAIVLPASRAGPSSGRRETSPTSGLLNRRLDGLRIRNTRGVEAEEGAAARVIPEMEFVRSRQQGVELARQEALEVFYGHE